MSGLFLSSSDTPTVWLGYFTALCIIEAFMLMNFRLFPNFWGSLINIWYDKFGLVAIMLDMLIVLIGFWITQKLYGYIFGSSTKLSVSVAASSWDTLWKFLLLFLGVQIIHDILFYVLVLKKSKGSNAIFDLINTYGSKHGFYTILGDSLMVILSIIMAWFLLKSDVSFSTYIICILCSLYMIGYLLYMKWN
jgi:hypothetical protein